MKIKLKTALLANATFSSISGVTMLLFSNWISELMGIPNKWVLPIIGGGLLFFASTIVYQATRDSINSNPVKLIILQDLLWVVGSLVILVFGLFDLTIVGKILIAIVAVAVADFAFLQWWGLRQELVE